MNKIKLVKLLIKLNIVLDLGFFVLSVVYLNGGDNFGWLFILL